MKNSPCAGSGSCSPMRSAFVRRSSSAQACLRSFQPGTPGFLLISTRTLKETTVRGYSAARAKGVQVLHCRHDDDGEGLVDFKQISLLNGPADPVEEFPQCADGRGGEPVRLLAEGRGADDAGEGLEAQGGGLLIRRENQRGGAVALE